MAIDVVFASIHTILRAIQNVPIPLQIIECPRLYDVMDSINGVIGALIDIRRHGLAILIFEVAVNELVVLRSGCFNGAFWHGGLIGMACGVGCTVEWSLEVVLEDVLLDGLQSRHGGGVVPVLRMCLMFRLGDEGGLGS
jgi:hypothetical protein